MNDRAVIGDSPRRRENARFVTGHGAYLDDLRFEGLTQAVSRRSPHAHARINGIDTANALKTGGVIAILTAAEAAADLGGGRGSSCATYMGGTAIWRASDTIITKGKTLAAQALEAAETDIVFGDGLFRVTGNDRTITLLELETNSPGALDICNQWTREAMTFLNGTHIAEVVVDPETGAVTVERLTAVDDYGVIVNPMIAAGQAHGAIAQGAGQAPMEHAVDDPASGQPISGSFMDYAIPRAGDLPSFDLSFAGTRCTTNPVGVKGCGEAGAVALFPAVANAIADAVGVASLNGPASPNRNWHGMQRTLS